jgi:putative ABC transport system substrate-binding protein
LRELGWIEGKNLTIERRYTAGSANLLRSFAQQLVDLKVEIVVTNGTAATLAAKDSTSTIPIIMLSAGDPVRNGLVASLAQPGGNVTGYALLSPETAARRLSLMRELLPRTERVGELEVSTNPYFRAARRDLEQAYRSVAIQPIFVEVAEPNEFEEAVAEVARQRGQVLHVPNDDLFANNAAIIRLSWIGVNSLRLADCCTTASTYQSCAAAPPFSSIGSYAVRNLAMSRLSNRRNSNCGSI